MNDTLTDTQPTVNAPTFDRKQYRKDHAEEIKQYKKQYYKDHAEEIRQYRKNHAEERKQYWKQYRKDHAEEIRQYRKNHAEEIKQHAIKRRYKLSIDALRDMYIRQNGNCEICGNHFQKGNGFHIDHNHSTGQVRGLLCRYCNSGIGHLNENVSNLKAAIEYLNKYNHYANRNIQITV